MKTTITIELDYHPGVGLGRVMRLLDLLPEQYGIREAVITVDEITTIRANRPFLSLERRARGSRRS